MTKYIYLLLQRKLYTSIIRHSTDNGEKNETKSISMDNHCGASCRSIDSKRVRGGEEGTDGD